MRGWRPDLPECWECWLVRDLITSWGEEEIFSLLSADWLAGWDWWQVSWPGQTVEPVSAPGLPAGCRDLQSVCRVQFSPTPPPPPPPHLYSQPQFLFCKQLSHPVVSGHLTTPPSQLCKPSRDNYNSDLRTGSWNIFIQRTLVVRSAVLITSDWEKSCLYQLNERGIFGKILVKFPALINQFHPIKWLPTDFDELENIPTCWVLRTSVESK